MTIAFFPGSFDPITIGHLDLIKRASMIFPRLVVAVGINPRKSSLFSVDEKTELIRMVIDEYELSKTVSVISFPGLLIDAMKEFEAAVVVKGVRNSGDLEQESIQATVNRQLGGIETVLLPTSPDVQHISSSMVRELALWGGDTSPYLTPAVSKKLQEKIQLLPSPEERR